MWLHIILISIIFEGKQKQKNENPNSLDMEWCFFFVLISVLLICACYSFFNINLLVVCKTYDLNGYKRQKHVFLYGIFVVNFSFNVTIPFLDAGSTEYYRYHCQNSRHLENIISGSLDFVHSPCASFFISIYFFRLFKRWFCVKTKLLFVTCSQFNRNQIPNRT